MLHQLKKLQTTFIIELGIVFIIVLPVIFIAYIGYESILIQSPGIEVISYIRLIFSIMILLSSILIFIIVHSFYIAKSKAVLIANEMTLSLRKNDERYKAFITNSTEGIWRFELKKPLSIHEPIKKQIEHCYEYAYLAECNDVFAKMYGYKKAEEIIGTPLKDMLIPTDQKNTEYLEKFITSGYKLTNSETVEKDKKGNIRYFHNTFIGVVEDDHVKRAWGTQRDVTERKELERMKDDFILTASHELRTPVTAIKGIASMLISGNFGKLDKKIERPLKVIDEASDKLLQISNDILDVSRIQAHRFHFIIEIVNLRSIIEKTAQTFQPIIAKKNISLLVGHIDDIKVHTDLTRFQHILHNLIDNAVKFTAKGSVTISAFKERNKIVIYIKDTGTGIPKDDLKNIFIKFQQISSKKMGKPSGTGLGLYIGRELARKLGGDVELARSEEGKGSTFILTIPINPVK
jgi:PAS domain S-box-containing protein